jgi:hypothetical protein
VAAAGRLGITVCATGYVSDPTIEHTWALILAAARNLLVEADSMRTGGWQVTVGTGLRGKTLGVLGNALLTTFRAPLLYRLVTTGDPIDEDLIAQAARVTLTAAPAGLLSTR